MGSQTKRTAKKTSKSPSQLVVNTQSGPRTHRKMETSPGAKFIKASSGRQQVSRKQGETASNINKVPKSPKVKLGSYIEP